MTIKKRLFWSNILMLLVPVVITGLIGLLCIGFMWLTLLNGAGLRLRGPEDFDRVSRGVTELAEFCIDHRTGFSSLDALLGSSGMSMQILQNGDLCYSYGETEETDQALLSAALSLGSDATVSQDGRSLHISRENFDGQEYILCLFGGNANGTTYTNLKIALAVSTLIIGFTVLLSIWATNRFLTRFVFRKIEEPLDILTGGVHELRDGNLDYRIDYHRQDEFEPVCQDFNEMARHLKESAEQLRQQEQSRKELIAGISHDIRSPLTSIQAYVEGLLDGIAKTPEAQRRYLETIKTKAEDLGHIVSQLFLFSKMDLDDYPEDRRPLRLDEVIRDSVPVEEYRQKGLSVTMDLEPVTMEADPVQLQRIVMNILGNSLKYKTEPQGQARICLKNTDTGCRLSFADDGPGVPEEALPHLFEVFYRSDPARQNPHQGSGLGLAIVAKTIERMGGTIRAQNGSPKGLEIIIDFPKEVLSHGENTDRGR